MRLVPLAAICVLVLLAPPTESRAQTHDAHPPSGASAPAPGQPGAAGAGDATSHEGMQHGGESPSEMMWSMYTDLGNIAYQNGLYGEAEKTYKSALKEARTFTPTDRRLGVSLNNLAEVYR